MDLIVYIDLVILLNFLVDSLLLLAVSKFCGTKESPRRILLGGALGGLYGGVCFAPEFAFLSGFVWRVAALAAVGATAFGLKRSAVHKCLIFALLNMTLGGMALLLETGDLLGLILCAASMPVLCLLAGRRRAAKGKYAAVELKYRGIRRKLSALRDTGNALCDPLTGLAVLVAGADIAREMLELSPEQLRRPVEVLPQLQLPGRLIPFQTIDNESGMLLAVAMDEVLIDGQPANRLVAFSPVNIGAGEDYEALTGGCI